MRAAGIDHVVVYDTDRQRLIAALEWLLADPGQWPLLYLDGGLTVFGWRDPTRAGPGDLFRTAERDPDRLALRPRSDEMAPLIRPTQDLEPRRWWEAFWKRAPPPPIDRDAAALYLLQAEVLRRSAAHRHLSAWGATQAAGLIGSAGGWANPGGLFDAQVRFEFFQPPLAVAYQPVFTQARDDTPAAIIYLAIRAARRALAANPRDAQAHATLGEAYLRLLHNTRERAWSRPFSELAQLRRAQAAAALTQAVALDPGLTQAHLNLAALYGEMGFLDLALKHQRHYLAGVRKVRPGAGVRAEEHRDAVAEVERQVDGLVEVVDRLEREFGREAPGLRVLDRAILARDLGLTGRARDILLESDIAAFGAIGMALELELLVRTGRAKEVRDWTAPEHQEALGPMYHWLRIQALAATGDYALAQVECNELATEGPSGSRHRQVMAALVGQSVCEGNRTIGSMGGGALDAFRQADFRIRLRQLLAAIRREADAITLRGLLQLEVGETDEAAADFRRALATWGGAAAAAQSRGIDFNGRVVAQAALAWIESVPARKEP
jgi:tetratricopeptide (TPR) repeat protein